MDDQRVFQTGAKRDNADGKGRMDLLPWNAVIELSKHCERGAKHYGENNVRKGIPFHSLADSGARHLAKWIAGITDEPTHLVAACWNLMWLLEETLTRQELNDMPWNKEAQKEAKVDEVGKALFHNKCPYTDIECQDWTCNTCEVQEAERGYMNGEA